MGRKLSEGHRRWLAQHIQNALDGLNWTRMRLAKKAGYDERTVRNVLAAYTAKFDTYANICRAVGLDVEALLASIPIDLPQESAPEVYGGYSRKIYERYLGNYVTIRPKYADPSIVKAYMTEITWDTTAGCYCFEERERIDAEYAHRGYLYFPAGSTCLYLMTIDKGWVRTVVVSQLSTGREIMRGMITSQYNVAGAAYAPVAAPIAYLKIGHNSTPSLGELTKTDRDYDRYLLVLQETMQNSFAHVSLPPMLLPSTNVVTLSARQRT
jgi:hypothetical protein